MAIYFQRAGEHWYYLRGAKEQAHNFGDIGSLAMLSACNQSRCHVTWLNPGTPH